MIDMEYATEADRIEARVLTVGDILDRLQETTPRRRAAILAVAGVVYDPDARLDVYAKPLMTLEDDELEGVSFAASTAALTYPMPRPENPIPEEDRLRYLHEARGILDSIDSDQGLAPAERRHLTVLVGQLADALAAAPLTGPQPVVTAATAIVGDLRLSPGLWERVHRKKWARRLAATVTGILMLVGAYSSGKELAQDFAALLDAGPAIAAVQHPEQASGQTDEGVPDAEIIDEAESPE